MLQNQPYENNTPQSSIASRPLIIGNCNPAVVKKYGFGELANPFLFLAPDAAIVLVKIMENENVLNRNMCSYIYSLRRANEWRVWRKVNRISPLKVTLA